MVSVIIPTLNEEKRIAEIIKFCRSSKRVREILVIDDGSIDETRDLALEAGAKVHFSSMLGKGTSMCDGLWRAQEDVVIFLDGDIFNFAEDLIEKMTDPILQNRCDFVKGKFHRKAGRVTALTARPLLQAFFPEISRIEQPLGGIIAARKDLLKKFSFEPDYGVDIALLIDIVQLGAKVEEADIGSLDHDHQSLDQLSNMSNQIVRAILERAHRYKKLDIFHLKDSFEIQRINQLQINSVVERIDPKQKLALLDMDGTLLEGRFIDRLARFASRENELSKLVDNHQLDPLQRTKLIAKSLAGIPKHVFEKIAQIIPLANNAQKLVVDLKRRGFTVGIVTDSYFVASEVIRKRVFADFSVAHLLEFKKGIFTGSVETSPLFFSDRCKKHKFCKLNLLDHLDRVHSMCKSKIYFAGDGLNDVCLLGALSNTYAVNPKSALVAKAASRVTYDLGEILEQWR